MPLKKLLPILFSFVIISCGGKSPVPIPSISPCAYSCESGKSFCANIEKPDEVFELPISETPIAISTKDYLAIDNFVKEIKKYFRENQALLKKIIKKNPELLNSFTEDEKKMLGCFGIECEVGG